MCLHQAAHFGQQFQILAAIKLYHQQRAQVVHHLAGKLARICASIQRSVDNF